MAGESADTVIDLTADSDNDTTTHVDNVSVTQQRRAKKLKRHQVVPTTLHRYPMNKFFTNYRALPSTDASLKLLNNFQSQAELLADITLDMVESLTIPPSSVLFINDGRFQNRFTRQMAGQIFEKLKTSNTYIICHAASRWRPFLMFRLPEDFVFAESSPLKDYVIRSSEIANITEAAYAVEEYLLQTKYLGNKKLIDRLIGKNCRFTAAVSESTIRQACDEMKKAHAVMLINGDKLTRGLNRAETMAILGLVKRKCVPLYLIPSDISECYRALFYVCRPSKEASFVGFQNTVILPPTKSLPPELLFDVDKAVVYSDGACAQNAETSLTDDGQNRIQPNGSIPKVQVAAIDTETDSKSAFTDVYPIEQFFETYRVLPQDSGNEKFLSDFCSGGRQRVDVEPHEADSLKITGSQLVVICCELFQKDFSRLEAARLFRKAKAVGSHVLVHTGVSTSACAFYRVNPSKLTKLPFFMHTIHNNEIKNIMECDTTSFSMQEFVKTSKCLTGLSSKVRLAERLADNTITYMDVTPPKSTPNVPVDTKRNTFMIIDVKKFEMTVSRSDAISFLRSTKSMGLSLLLIAPSMSGVIPVAVYMCSTSSAGYSIRILKEMMISPIHIDVSLAGAPVTSNISPPLVADYDGGSAQISTEAADESNPFSDLSPMNNAFSDLCKRNKTVTTLPSNNTIPQANEARRVDHGGSSQTNISDRAPAKEQQSSGQGGTPNGIVDEAKGNGMPPSLNAGTELERLCFKVSLEEEEIALQAAVFDLTARIEFIEDMEDEAMQELDERKIRAKPVQDTIEELSELLEQQESEQLTLAAEVASLEAELVGLEREYTGTISENGSFAEDE